ncbi:MAG: SlyX family protein [Geobacter sp.]|nr:MAG: SlyX family protein [Geobacter sp.]
MNERITNIEIQLMHHENTIQQLSDVISHQQQDIEKLQRELRLIMKHLQSAAPAEMRAPEDEEPPPHY